MSRGSEWRKWDLHVHTASSYDYKHKNIDSDEILVKSWKEKELSVVAITDHFVIDKERILKLKELAPDIKILPGVELRCDKGSTNLHVILIFSDEDIENLVNQFNVIMLSNKAKAKDKDETIYWDYNDILEFAKNNNAIISIHAGKKTSGVDREITNSVEINQAIKTEIASDIHIFEMGRKEDLENYNKHVFTKIDRKPMIICSDNHDCRDYKIKESLWIKSEPTFEGLLQAIKEPELRFFIGDNPPKNIIVQNNPDKFLESIQISGIDSKHKWFNDTIHLNTDLVTVIGNKGNGKSAFADIIGHAGNTKNTRFSFLSEERFNQKPERLGKYYSVKIKWKNGVEEERLLYPLESGSSVEKVKYLPQQYIEYICNDLKNGFKSEIERLIFDYIPHSEKLGNESLQSLISHLTKDIIKNIEDNKFKLKELNKQIIDMEIGSSDKAIKSLKLRLKDLEMQLEQESKNKPDTVEKPEIEAEQNTEINNLNTEIKNLKSKIQIRRNDLSVLSQKKYKLESIIEGIKSYKDKFNVWIEDINTDLANEGIEQKISGSIDIRYEELNILNSDIKNKINKIKGEISIKEDDNIDGSIIMELKEKQSKLEGIMNTLSDSQLKYQQYIQASLKYKERIEKISNDLLKVKEAIKKAEEDLPSQLETAYKERKEICRSIYEEKNKIANIYIEKYTYINNAIDMLNINDSDKPQIETSFSLDIDCMSEKLFNNINHKVKSIFLGKDQAKQSLSNFLEDVDINKFDDLVDSLNNMSIELKTSASDYEKVFKDRCEFFNSLYGLEYINIDYNLKLGEKLLSKLSPGERGLVLLIFYLVLDKDNLPLIIDQPEDNLDNQSIFKKLVPYIIKAKERRQIIIITHNPNIAVACDSEQIIYSHMNNENMEIRYTSGSMETKEISMHIINVLEGTMPAFDKRKDKYKL